jgi:phosphoserine aminotransferase
MFVCPVPDPEDRSRMNVVFVMAPGYEELEKAFLTKAKELNILGIEGHRSVGGFRASIYNAMPIESVAVLVAAMKEFEAQN